MNNFATFPQFSILTFYKVMFFLFFFTKTKRNGIGVKGYCNRQLILLQLVSAMKKVLGLFKFNHIWLREEAFLGK